MASIIVHNLLIMTKIFVTISLIVISHSLIAQDSIKVQEVGISFISFNEFGLTYRTGKPKSLWRVNTLFISGSQSQEIADSVERSDNGIGVQVEIGKENRKEIAKDFKLRYGFDLGFRYNKSIRKKMDLANPTRDRDDTSFSYGAYINIVLGFNYELSESLLVGIEILPSINYSKGTSIEYNPFSGNYDEFDKSSFSYGFSNNSARLSLVYRF